MARQYGPCARTAKPPPKATTTRSLVTTSRPTAKRISRSAAYDHARGPRVARVRSGADVGREVLAGEGGAGGDEVGGGALEDGPAAVVAGAGPRSMPPLQPATHRET